MMYFPNRKLQIQLRFDPTKHFRATANPISMPYFSQQPMPTHKRQDGEDPAHWTRRLSRMVGSSEVTLSPLNFTYIYI